MKKVILCVAVFCFAVGSVSADAWFENGTGNTLWSDPLNWNPNVVPTSANGWAAFGLSTTVTVDAPASCTDLYGSHPGTDALPDVTINIQDDLDVLYNFYMGHTGTTTVNQTAGDVTAGYNMLIGWAGDSVYNMSAGSLTTPGALILSNAGTNAGELYLDGGIVTAGSMAMGAGGLVDITEGILKVAGDFTETVDFFIGTNQFLGYGGTGIVQSSYDELEGYTTITASAIPEPATMALLGLGAVLLRRKRA